MAEKRDYYEVLEVALEVSAVLAVAVVHSSVVIVAAIFASR